MTPYEAAHRGVAFRQRRERGVLIVTGKDRLAWLQGLVTNDVAFAGPGTEYAAWLTPQGRMVTDLTIVETGDQTWLDVPAALAEALALRLDLMIFTEEARVEDCSHALASIDVVGPGAVAAIQTALHDNNDPMALPEGHGHLPVGRRRIGDDAVFIIRALSAGVPGLELFTSAAGVATLEDALGRGGAVKLDDGTATVLRVEAGLPAFLVDMGDETIPLEANLDRALSHTKGCYIGQEIIVRIRDRAHGRVARRLVGLLPEGQAVPRAGQGVTRDGRQAGRLTSAVLSPALGRPIALATLLRDFTEPGTVVALEDGTRATVARLPFTIDG